MSKALITEQYLTDIANSIRAKLGVATEYKPSEMSAAIDSISGGGGITVEPLSVTQNGTYTAPAGKAYTPISVNVSGGGGSPGIWVGTTDPTSEIGSDGDYYYKRELEDSPGCLSTPSSTSGTTISGYEFYPKANIKVNGLRGYVRGTTVGSLILTTDSGVELARVDNISLVSGWNQVSLQTPVTLTSNSHYIVMISVQNSVLSYKSKSSMIFDARIEPVCGRYGSIPGSQDSANIYGADIIIAGELYIVIGQFYKESGTWGQIA